MVEFCDISVIVKIKTLFFMQKKFVKTWKSLKTKKSKPKYITYCRKEQSTV